MFTARQAQRMTKIAIEQNKQALEKELNALVVKYKTRLDTKLQLCIMERIKKGENRTEEIEIDSLMPQNLIEYFSDHYNTQEYLEPLHKVLTKTLKELEKNGYNITIIHNNKFLLSLLDRIFLNFKMPGYITISW